MGHLTGPGCTSAADTQECRRYHTRDNSVSSSEPPRSNVTPYCTPISRYYRSNTGGHPRVKLHARVGPRVPHPGARVLFSPVPAAPHHSSVRSTCPVFLPC
uniref:Uncharacterized protein n=1 Tax=Cacopsylla melanoneura TaxID=428564 RepID=A0A8D8WC09_9HEMI